MPSINNVNEVTAQIQTLPRVKSNEKGLRAVLEKIPGEEYLRIDVFEPTKFSLNNPIDIWIVRKLTLARDLKFRKDSEAKALFQPYQ